MTQPRIHTHPIDYWLTCSVYGVIVLCSLSWYQNQRAIALSVLISSFLKLFSAIVVMIAQFWLLPKGARDLMTAKGEKPLSRLPAFIAARRHLSRVPCTGSNNLTLTIIRSDSSKTKVVRLFRFIRLSFVLSCWFRLQMIIVYSLFIESFFLFMHVDNTSRQSASNIKKKVLQAR